MKVKLNNITYSIPDANIIDITVLVSPSMRSDPTSSNPTHIAAAMYYSSKDKRYHTDVNPDRKIEGPLSEENDILTGDLGIEWDQYIEDCKSLIETVGFIILARDPDPKSPKSRYFIVFGMKSKPFGLLVFDLRVSDHPHTIEFPANSKIDALSQLKRLGIVDAAVTVDDIDFDVESVLVGNVKEDTWDRAYFRLYEKLNSMKRNVMTHLARYEEFKVSYVPIAFTSDETQLGGDLHYDTWSDCMSQFDTWRQEGYTLDDLYIKTYQGSRCVQSTHIE